MKIRFLATDDWTADFWEDWDSLNQRYTHNHPMLQSRFLKPLIRYFGKGVIAAIGGNQRSVQGIMLLNSNPRWCGTIRPAFLPSQAQIALIQAGENPEVFIDACQKALPPITLRLDLFAVDSEYQASLCAIPDATRTVRGIDMSIQLSGPFDAYWNARPKNLKKNINRYHNRIKRDLGAQKLKVITGESVALATDRYGFLESKGWKGAEGTALHPGNAQGQFYREVLDAFSQSGEAAVFELWTGEKFLASRLCIMNSEQIIILKTTFDESAKAFAPGRLLLHEMLQQLFRENGNRHLEFYTNASKDQLDWSTSSRPTYHLSAHKYRWSRLWHMARNRQQQSTPEINQS